MPAKHPTQDPISICARRAYQTGQDGGVIVALIIGLSALLVLVFGVVIARSYNTLQGGRQDVREAWSGVDVQLTRRHHVIGQLVDVVRGYAATEQDAIAEVTTRRIAASTAGDPKVRGEADRELDRSMTQLVARAEGYPDLRADEQFARLSQELTTVEDDIASARRYYNGHVGRYNTERETLPTSLVSTLFGFGPSSYYQTEEDEQEVVRHVFDAR